MTTYTNDPYGRRTSRVTPSGTTTYTWDPEGHLSRITSADATITYAYGIAGMREKKIVETMSGTTWTKSVRAGGRFKAEFGSDGTRYTYLWGPDRTPLSVFVERSTGATETYAYHTDALGSVVAMTNSSGRVVARYAYDPATYRFLSPDPAPPSAADPLSLNAYAYCLGDPVGLTDPSGAVVDVDGDGRLDSEDSASENYIRTPASSRHKAARRAEMVAAEARAQAQRAAELNRRAMGDSQAAGEEGRGIVGAVLTGLSIGLGVIGVASSVFVLGVAVGAITVSTGGSGLILLAGIGGATSSFVGGFLSEFAYRKGYTSRAVRDVGVGLAAVGTFASLVNGSGPIATAIGMQGFCAGTVGLSLTAADSLSD